MAATPWLLLLCLAAASGGVLQARAQPDSKGFITIDCGLQGETGYVDNVTKLAYAPDNGEFTDDAGTCHNISAEYITPSMAKSWYKVRSFTVGARNCYTLRSLVPGLKYLVRASFMYGNYDGLNRPPVFDLHVGVNYWHTVSISGPDAAKQVEVIVVVPDDFVHVCLVNTGAGTPFISALELRPLKRTIYPQATASEGLVLLARLNFGPTDENDVIRYPDDPHDRIWIPWVNSVTWSEISTKRNVQYVANSFFEAPTAVMRTAIIPRNASNNIEFSWEPQPQPSDRSPGYIAIMHFSELQRLSKNAIREMYVNVNSEPWYPDGFRPKYLYSDATYNMLASPSRKSQHIVSIDATASSTLPPIINAFEVYSVIPTTNLGTNSQDVSAIMTIKANYHVHKNWMGDPCGPDTIMVWDSLNWSYSIVSPPRIRSIDLSSRDLNGDISASFASLTALEYLNLSNNKLKGSIPDALSQLTSLAVLDLSGNQLSGSIPPGLLKRAQDSSLNLRYDNNPGLCTNGNSCQPSTRKTKLAIYIASVGLVMVVIAVVVLLFSFIRKKMRGSMNSVVPQNSQQFSRANSQRTSRVNSQRLTRANSQRFSRANSQRFSRANSQRFSRASSQRFENRGFTYEELEIITNNFQQVLGKGGFGSVYNGFLKDGTQVAVKLQSNYSSQGVKEFFAEADTLARIHHKHLVSIVGYCDDGEDMALVYEYMSEGNLQQHIEGSRYHGGCLPWKHRLRIAHQSAQGLDYLHKGCNPPVIHRDVKATNILLNSRMEAKIADFGLSKAFNSDKEHVSTDTVAGTIGYLDPEYHATMLLTTKSDVYSFGVVLLELVTGKPVILREAEPIGIIQWTRQRMVRGNIERVVDARMRGNYDVNCVWKVVEIALKCTAYASTQRPTMTNVVAQLQECIELEESNIFDANGDFYTNGNHDNPNFRYDANVADQSTNKNQNNTAFSMERPGPAAR